MKVFSHHLSVLLGLALLAGVQLSSSAQNTAISGKVTDESGAPLSGITITEKGTLNGTVSDASGSFTLSVKPGAILTASSLGYRALDQQARSGMVFSMVEDTEYLDELVVIGYGTVAKGDITTAVSSIDNKEITERPITSALQAIAGKAAGVLISETSGAPGADLSINVRGITSITGSNSPLYVVDGVVVENLQFLSPADILNIQILKDASGAAIYGSRAANGVVLITTKSGEAGESRISFNAQLGISSLNNPTQPLNASQYDDLMGELGFATYGKGDVTDWYDVIYRTGITQNYQLSLSSGTDKTKYFLSAGYLDDQGIIKETYHKRYSFRAKVDSNIRKWLSVGTNVSYSNYGSRGVTTGLPANRGGFTLAAVNLPTGASVWDDVMDAYNRDFNGLNLTNAAEAIANNRDNNSTNSHLIASGSATVNLFKGLSFKSQFTYDRTDAISQTFTPPVYIKEDPGVHEARTEFGSASDNRWSTMLTMFDNVFTYKNDFHKHGVTAMAGTSWSYDYYTNNYMTGTHFRNGSIHTVNAANKVGINAAGSSGSEWAMMSYFARLSYNYDSRYLVTANVRADGSSKLHPNHRWGVFPSFSAAWRISSEEFMRNAGWVNDLKLRLSWGQTGNQSGIGNYSYLQTYSISRVDWTKPGDEDALPGITADNLRNSDLTWETTSQTDIGLDASLLKGRLGFTFDFYDKLTSDMLMNVTLPSGNIASSITRNEGVMRNRGVELSIHSVNFQGDFEWLTSFNISHNRNMLESLQLQQVYTAGYINSEILRTDIVRNEPGRPLGGFYGYVFDGVDSDTGAPVYKDLDGKEGITPDDMTYIGDPNPDFTYGFGTSLTWKGFSLDMQFNGVQGNDIANINLIQETDLSRTQMNIRRKAFRESWSSANPNGRYPAIGVYSTAETKFFSDRFVEDGSYLRLSDISLSYKIPLRKKSFVKSIDLSVSASNLLLITKYSGFDPEVNSFGSDMMKMGVDYGSYPSARSFATGIKMTF